MKALLRKTFLTFARLSKRFSRENRYEWLAEDLENLPKGGKVLCIGGGGRYFLIRPFGTKSSPRR